MLHNTEHTERTIDDPIYADLSCKNEWNRTDYNRIEWNRPDYKQSRLEYKKL